MNIMKFFALKCEEAVDHEALANLPEIQISDARAVAGEEHIAFAIAQAQRAFSNSCNISRNKQIEVLIRASAQRQINVGIDRLGVDNTRDVVVIAEMFPEEFIRQYKCRECKKVLEITPEKLDYLKKLFNINERELEAVGAGSFDEMREAIKNIIIERIALLNL
ncbi:kinase binding protein CGI-121 [archaeon]|nr:kinase binding protein CGI-121 [archaeon]